MFIVYTPEGRTPLTVSTSVPPVPPVVQTGPVSAHQTGEAGTTGTGSMNRALLKHRALQAYRTQARRQRGTRLETVMALMMPPPPVLGPDTLLETAWARVATLSPDFVLVAREETGGRAQPIGWLSRRHFVGHVWQVSKQMRVRMGVVEQIMTPQVVVCHPHTSLRLAAQTLALHDMPAMPVMDEEGTTLIGLLSAQRILQQLAQSPPLEVYA